MLVVEGGDPIGEWSVGAGGERGEVVKGGALMQCWWGKEETPLVSGQCVWGGGV